MAIGKGSLERVAKATVASPAQEVTATVVPAQQEPIVEPKPKKAPAKKVAATKKMYAVGDALPEYLL